MKKNLSLPRNTPQDFTTSFHEDKALVETINKKVEPHLHKKRDTVSPPRGPKLKSIDYF